MSASNKKFYTDVQIKSDILIDGASVNTVPVFDGSKKIKSSTVSTTELEYLSGTTSSVQDQLDAAQSAADAAQQDIDDHIADAVDAHDASAISNIPSGNLAATDVQGALNELQSDIDTRALDSAVIKKNGSVAFTAAQSMGGFKLTNVADPTSAQDAATKSYVDAVAQGLKPKAAVRAATLVNGVLATAFEDGDTIDAVVLATGDRILIKNQTAAEDNGIYIVQASGAPVRAPDFDSLSPIDEINGAYTFVQEGSQAGQGWVQTGLVTAIGVDPINFVYFNSVASITGGDGITVTGSDISVDHDGQGLTFSGVQLALELDGATLSKSASGLKLTDTAVTPGSYGSATQVSAITVDQQGRLTAAASTSIAIPASQVTDFNEAAQDAVGTILVDSASIDFTYNDGTPSIVAAVLPAGVDHNSLQNFVANKHIDHSAVSIATAASTSGLSGGGDITATRNLVVDITGTTALGAGPDAADEVMIWDSSASARKKVTITELLSSVDVGSPGDIDETAFSFSNNVAAPANVTGLAFANGVVRSFQALVSVYVDATSDLFEEFELNGIQRGADWAMSVESTGDDSGAAFTITTAGQIQYTSANSAGFSAGTMKFRAITTSV